MDARESGEKVKPVSRVVSDARVEHGQEARRLAEVGADVLSKALDLGAQIKDFIRLRRIKLADQLLEQLVPVLVAGLSQLVAQDLVEARHEEPVKDILLARVVVKSL